MKARQVFIFLAVCLCTSTAFAQKKPKSGGGGTAWGDDEPTHEQTADPGAYDESLHRDERAIAEPQSLSLSANRTAVVTYSGSNSTAASGSASFLVKQLSEIESVLSHAGKRLADITAITLT